MFGRYEYPKINSTNIYKPIHSYTKPQNIFPSPVQDLATSTINLRSTIHNNKNISYYVKFDVVGYICTQPKITIYFEDTDFDGADGTEFLNVYHRESLIASCGSNNETCGDFKYCLTNYSLQYGQSVAVGEQIIIHLEKGKDSGVPPSCNYSLWADITLSCEKLCYEYNTSIDSNYETNGPKFNSTLLSISQYDTNINGINFAATDISQNYLGLVIDCIVDQNCIIDCDYQTGCLLTEINVHTNKSMVLSCTKLWHVEIQCLYQH